MASCHLDGFPETATSQMGQQWVEYLYAYYLQNQKGIAVVAIGQDGNVDGVAIGGDRRIPRKYRRACLQKFPISLFIKTLTNSSVRTSVFTGVRDAVKNRKMKQTKTIDDSDTRAGLLSICVRPNAIGTGVASDLLFAFEQHCWKMNFELIQLGVRVENVRAQGFYNKSGWSVNEALSDRVAFQYQKLRNKQEEDQYFP